MQTKSLKNKSMMVGAVMGLALAGRAGAQTTIVDNLATTYGSTGNAIESAKNAANTDYSQGFTVPAGDGGYLDSLVMDLTVKATSLGNNVNPSGADTLDIYLYPAQSSGGNAGDPVVNSTPIAELAAGITQTDIEGGTLEAYGSTGSINSDIYKYTVDLTGSLPYLTAGDTYAIQVDVSSGTQDVGWGENNLKDANELGQIDPTPVDEDPYGAMDIATGLDPIGNATTVPDSASTALLLGGVMSAVVFVRRKMALSHRVRP